MNIDVPGETMHRIEKLRIEFSKLQDQELQRLFLLATSLLGMWQDVRDFHIKFDIPHPLVPTPLSATRADLRKMLIREESREALEAIDSGDLPKIAQECVDLVYVALGTLVEAGISPDLSWIVVHHANMQKAKNPDGGKIIKPPGWVPPDMGGVLAVQESTPIIPDEVNQDPRGDRQSQPGQLHRQQEVDGQVSGTPEDQLTS